MTTNPPPPADGERPTPEGRGYHHTTPYGEPLYPHYPADQYRPDQSAFQAGHGQHGYYYPPQAYQAPQGYPPAQAYPAYPTYPYYGYGQPPVPPKKSSRGLLGGLVALVVAAAVVVATVGFSSAASNDVAGRGSVLQLPQQTPNGGGTVPGSGNTGTGSQKGVATSTQQIGIVTIVSVLSFQRAESAGTGMIMTSDGEVLTNNHVVNGATSITVTVESTGQSYKASVVGTAPTKDVAVLQLRNASGLTPAKFADSSSDVAVGDAVTGVGNAGGTGTLTAASGKVTALNQSITATDETGQEAERLHDLIEINAPIISGDSGGPLYDADGEIIGIDTAASSNRTSSTSRAYAIRIDNAMSVADQIESGVATTTIHIGLPGFLGVAPVASSNGVGVQQVTPGQPAAKAGITAGSVITSIDGTAITSTTQLHNLLSGKDPGDRVSVRWTDASGRSHTATVTLATGPAD